MGFPSNTANYIATNSVSKIPLQLAPSPYLTGSAGADPSYTSAQSIALVAGAKTVGQDLFSASGTTVALSSGIVVLSGQDFYAAPPASLQVTTASTYAVLYISKQASGTSATSAKIGLLETPSATSPSEALSDAASSITGVYVPLAVLSSDASSNQTIEWSLDQNSQYSAPIFNELGLIGQWEATTKTFIETQLSALMSDLTGFASWEQGARNNQVYISFDNNAAANGLEVLGEWTPGNPAWTLPCITGSLLNRTLTLTLSPHQMTASNPVPTVIFPQVHNNYDNIDGWWAPSQDVFFPAACAVFSGGNFIGVQGAQWLSSTGNLVLTGGSAAGQQMVPLSTTLSPIPAGVQINGYRGTQQVQNLAPNPLANPTFQTGW
ncbi:MAG: hypothetical protein IIY98_04070 [Aeriscardovia sp.]|nr:hypothetical protein [Aeriscardovia sp.]